MIFPPKLHWLTRRGNTLTSTFAKISNNIFCLSTSPSTPRVDQPEVSEGNHYKSPLSFRDVCSNTPTAQKRPCGQLVGPPQEHWLLERADHISWTAEQTLLLLCLGHANRSRTAIIRTVSRSQFSLKHTPAVSSFYWMNTIAGMLLRKTACGLSSFPKSPNEAHLLYVGTLRANSVTILLML